MARLSLALCAALMLVPSLKARAQDPTARYDKVHTIKVGGERGWDFLEVDAANRKLYVARSTRVVVIDIETEKVIGEIPDTPGVHGIDCICRPRRPNRRPPRPTRPRPEAAAVTCPIRLSSWWSGSDSELF